jgi:hypothetical protein
MDCLVKSNRAATSFGAAAGLLCINERARAVFVFLRLVAFILDFLDIAIARVGLI